MDLELLKHANEYILKMANGINPLTNETVNENDLINNIKISRCLFYVNNILNNVILNNGINNSKRNIKKIKFNIDKKDLEKYQYYEEDVPISKIVKNINILKTNENMSNLKVSDILKWLISIDVLIEKIDNGKKHKEPTELGKSMGIYLEHRFGNYGSYDILMYKKNMQEFIINNFECILDFINNN